MLFCPFEWDVYKYTYVVIISLIVLDQKPVQDVFLQQKSMLMNDATFWMILTMLVSHSLLGLSAT